MNQSHLVVSDSAHIDKILVMNTVTVKKKTLVIYLMHIKFILYNPLYNFFYKSNNYIHSQNS